MPCWPMSRSRRSSTISWLKPGEMLDGLGMAETTPGPLIMVLQFVGFMAAFRDPGSLSPMLAGTLGGLLATWVTFIPCFLWIFLGAPFIETLRGNKALAGALVGHHRRGRRRDPQPRDLVRDPHRFPRGPAGSGLRLRLRCPGADPASILGLRAVAAAAIAIFRFKIGMIPVLAACSAAGIALHLAGVVT